MTASLRTAHMDCAYVGREERKKPRRGSDAVLVLVPLLSREWWWSDSEAHHRWVVPEPGGGVNAYTAVELGAVANGKSLSEEMRKRKKRQHGAGIFTKEGDGGIGPNKGPKTGRPRAFQILARIANNLAPERNPQAGTLARTALQSTEALCHIHEHIGHGSIPISPMIPNNASTTALTPYLTLQHICDRLQSSPQKGQSSCGRNPMAWISEIGDRLKANISGGERGEGARDGEEDGTREVPRRWPDRDMLDAGRNCAGLNLQLDLQGQAKTFVPLRRSHVIQRTSSTHPLNFDPPRLGDDALVRIVSGTGRFVGKSKIAQSEGTIIHTTSGLAVSHAYDHDSFKMGGRQHRKAGRLVGVQAQADLVLHVLERRIGGVGLERLEAHGLERLHIIDNCAATWIVVGGL
ncbi:hypothetical protein EDB83DRAFT_2318044 [Lactarius deliciosus]|nr:hypothetical protein EDB83DRAFT_2318044 [Lactarius deliciosus]